MPETQTPFVLSTISKDPLASHPSHSSGTAQLKEPQSSLIQTVWGGLRSGLKECGKICREAFQLRWDSLCIVGLFLAIFLPVIFRATGNMRLLLSFMNDEIPLTMALDGMRAWPFGNPANFLYASEHPEVLKLPAYWEDISFHWYVYYGGAYFAFAFPFFALAHLLGAPTFPLAPVLLRGITVLSSALSVLATYNLGRQWMGRLTGVLAVLFLVTTPDFVMFSSVIHPDSMQMLFALLGLYTAIRHSQTGKLDSLVALGIFAGLVTGSKFGLPWMIPMAGLSILWGGQVAKLPLLQTVLKRGSIFALTAVLFFFVSTPYAFPLLDWNLYYFKSLKNLYRLLKTSPMTTVTPMTWLMATYQAGIGPLFATLSLTGLALACNRLFSGWFSGNTQAVSNTRKAWILTAVLGISQLAWYGFTGKFWVVTSYFLVLYAVVGLFAGGAVQQLAQGCQAILKKRPLLSQAAVGLLVTGILGATLWQRWPSLVLPILTHHLAESSTVIQVDAWAKAQHLPKETHFLYDDIAYLDGEHFPHAKMLGGIMTEEAVKQWMPNYLILSSSIYESAHIAAVIQTQKNGPSKLYEPDVQIYQALLPLNAQHSVNSRFPWIHYVQTIHPTQDVANLYRLISKDTITGVSRWIEGLPVSGEMQTTLKNQVIGQLQTINLVYGYLEGLTGDLKVHPGPTLQIYRVENPADYGIPVAFSSPSIKNRFATNAYDGKRSFWQSRLVGREAVGSYIGYDYGQKFQKTNRLTGVSVFWRGTQGTPTRLAVETSVDMKHWRRQSVFSVLSPVRNKKGWTSLLRFPRPLQARAIRLIAVDVPPERTFAVRELTWQYFQKNREKK